MTKSFERAGQGLRIDFDLNQLTGIPDIIHAYGAPSFPSIPDKLCWMTYEEGMDVSSFGHSKPGSISFTRNTAKYLPELAQEVVLQLTKRFPAIDWLTERVHIARTSGFIPPHTDEVRACALNIGLFNSNSARSLTSNNNRLQDFNADQRDLSEYVMEDGDIYLLDVSRLHCVEPVGDDAYRYLITYGFAAPFKTVLTGLHWHRRSND